MPDLFLSRIFGFAVPLFLDSPFPWQVLVHLLGKASPPNILSLNSHRLLILLDFLLFHDYLTCVDLSLVNRM